VRLSLAQWLTLLGLLLDAIGVGIVAYGQRWMLQFWNDAPNIFGRVSHKWIYWGAWGAIVAGFLLQAAGVLCQR
jgi:hypothetical protein